MNIDDLIKKTEEDLIPAIEAFFNRKWGDTKLWSHDLSHHRRVWEFAKELLQYADKPCRISIEKLLIACYLHDIGMSIDKGEKHGMHCRMFCELFLDEKNINPAAYADLLEAVQNHDNKEYKANQKVNRILAYLNVADDLDAFGYTGIYRYIEIYTARGIKPEDIAKLVLKNATARYTHFMNSFKSFPELVKKHQSRYSVLKDFFENLNSEISGPEVR